MAKLSAHGYEVARLTKSWTLTHEDGDTTDYIVTLSFRSDGQVMRKLKALNIHSTHYGASPHHDYGWKLYKALPDPKRDTIARLLKIANSYRDQSAANGNLIDYKESF